VAWEAFLHPGDHGAYAGVALARDQSVNVAAALVLGAGDQVAAFQMAM
jgi:hypothetical protein